MFLDNCTRWELGGSHCLLRLGILNINNAGIESPILLSLTSNHDTIPSKSSVHRGAETTALHTRVNEARA